MSSRRVSTTTGHSKPDSNAGGYWAGRVSEISSPEMLFETRLGTRRESTPPAMPDTILFSLAVVEIPLSNAS